MENTPKHPKTARLFTALLAALDISASKLAREISTAEETYSQQVISNYVAGKSKAGDKVLAAIARRYKALDASWLVTGQGEPFPNGRYDEKPVLTAAAQEPAASYATAPVEPLSHQLLQQLSDERRQHREEIRELKRDHREDVRTAATNHENNLAEMRRQVDNAKEETVRVREEKDERIRQLEYEVHMLKLAAGQRGPTPEEADYLEQVEEKRRAKEEQAKKQAGFRPEGVVGTMALSHWDPDFIRPQEVTEASELKIAA